MRDGGEEIGESCVLGGGVLPRKGRRPLDGALRVLGGRSGLEGRGLLLCGGAIVSLRGSGVSGRASMEGNNLGDDPSASSSPSPCSSLRGLVAGIVSSASSALGEGKLGLDRGTWIADSFRFLELEEDGPPEELVIFLVFDRLRGVDSSSGLKSSSSSSKSKGSS